MAKRTKPPVLNPAVQMGHLRRLFPDGVGTLSAGALQWRGPIHPTPLSDTYTIEVRYRAGGPAKVYVADPDLIVPDGMRLPHTFPGKRLCLHFPGEWNGSMRIADTIVPWASEWLMHYEFWLATGEWHGGGHEPEGPKSES